MDQNTSFHNIAKQILNKDSKNAFDDSEVTEIISILESFADIICNQKK